MSRPTGIVLLAAAGLLLLGGAVVIYVPQWLYPSVRGGTRGESQRGEGEEQQLSSFAIDHAASAVQAVPFDGKRAMGYLEAVCAIGPRMSGTAGMRKQQELIRKHFEGLGVKVQEQPFTARQVSRENAVAMTNLI